MHRRQFLQLAGASLGAGCSGLIQADGEAPTETVTPVPVDSVTDTASREPQEDDEPESNSGPDEPEAFEGTRVVDLETGPRTLAIRGGTDDSDIGGVTFEGPDGGIVHVGFTGTAASDRPATVRAVLVNGNDWGNKFRLDEFPALDGSNYARLDRDEFDRRFESSASEGREPALFLAPTAEHDLVDEMVTVERGPEGYWLTEPYPPELPETVTLGAGDFVTGEYYVVGHWDRPGFPTGRYDFAGPSNEFGLVAWDAASPGPASPSRFTGPVGSLPDDDATPWFHEAAEWTRVYLQPDRERVELPEKLSFRLVNHSRERLSGNPRFWELYKRVDGTWHAVVPRQIPAPGDTLTPGETYDYALSLFDGEAFEADDPHADVAASVGRLGGGRYAFVGGFSREDGDAPAAMFDVDAPTAPLSLPDGAVRYRVDDRVVVTLPSWGEDGDPPDATLTLRRADVDGYADVGDTFVREAVTRERMRALESALVVIDDAETAVVRADERAVGNVVTGDRPYRRFSFEGTTYLARAMFTD